MDEIVREKGVEGFVPWRPVGKYAKRYPDADFGAYLAGWGSDPTHPEFHGCTERNVDHRFYNCWSSLVFDSATGEPWSGVQMQTNDEMLLEICGIHGISWRPTMS